MIGDRGTLREVKREKTGGMRSEWDRTGRKYTGAVQEWRERCNFSDFLLAMPVL